MVSLRNFDKEDAPFLQAHYPRMSLNDILDMIGAWNKRSYGGKYFEMFAVTSGGETVGTVSLFQISEKVISGGPEIFPAFRRLGYAYEALILAYEYAKKLGFETAFAEIRKDNEASIALHKKLGFELLGEYTNKKKNEVYLFVKTI